MCQPTSLPLFCAHALVSPVLPLLVCSVRALLCKSVYVFTQQGYSSNSGTTGTHNRAGVACVCMVCVLYRWAKKCSSYTRSSVSCIAAGHTTTRQQHAPRMCPCRHTAARAQCPTGRQWLQYTIYGASVAGILHARETAHTRTTQPTISGFKDKIETHTHAGTLAQHLVCRQHLRLALEAQSRHPA